MKTSEREVRDKARITANDLALYMVSSATMQMTIIERNKYPNKFAILPYQDAKPWIVNFLSDPRRDKSNLAEGIDSFHKKAADQRVSEGKKTMPSCASRLLKRSMAPMLGSASARSSLSVHLKSLSLCISRASQ